MTLKIAHTRGKTDSNVLTVAVRRQMGENRRVVGSARFSFTHFPPAPIFPAEALFRRQSGVV